MKSTKNKETFLNNEIVFRNDSYKNYFLDFSYFINSLISENPKIVNVASWTYLSREKLFQKIGYFLACFVLFSKNLHFNNKSNF